jgi:hypothetical protein
MADRRYRALLVTNWEFPDDPTGLPPLRGPQVDAGIMRAALTDERTGLHTVADVEVVANAGKQEVLLRLEDFFRDAGRDDQLLLYYSGHGQLDLAGRLFLCARDSKVDRLLATAVAARDISDLMDESRARAKVVVLDCCHSGGFKGGADLPEGLAGRGRFVLSSSLPGQRTKDAEDDTAGSPFTRFVVEVLSSGAPDDDHDGYVSVDDLYHHVTKRMSDAGLSTPQRRFDDAVASVAVARTPSQAPTPTVTPPIEPAPATLADFLKADGFERRGRPELAAPLYRRVAGAGLGDWSTLAAFRQAKIATDPDQAASAYRQVIAGQHPEWSAEAAYRLGKALAEASDYEGSEQAFLTAVELDHLTWSPAAAVELADWIAVRTEPADTLVEAKPLLDHALGARSDETAARAAHYLGHLYAQTNDNMAARAAFRRAVLLSVPVWSAQAASALDRLRT